jgi:hypothetical protein
MMRSKIFWSAVFFLLSASLLPTKLKAQIAVKPGDEQLFAAQPKQYPFTLVAYGDLRTTHPSNHFVTDPNRRRVLIARIDHDKLNFEMFKLEGNNPQFSFNVRDSFQISAK